MDLSTFREVWLVDFEFSAPPGDRPTPICLVAREYRTGRTVRLFGDDLRLCSAPYGVGEDTLFIAFYASAEVGCHLSLGWPVPTCVLDLYVEFRNATNGDLTRRDNSLLGALDHYGLRSIEATHKEAMRSLAIRGAPFTADEKLGLLEYCESDVIALGQLLRKMEPMIDLDRAVLRGRYMAAAAAIEHTGVPVDAPALTRLRAEWEGIQERLVQRVNVHYDVFEGTSFREKKFADYLGREGIPWPRLESGRLALDDSTFKDMTRCHPKLGMLHDLRKNLGKLRLADLTVGTDARNRTILSAFASRTGRNQPSNSRFIFGLASWLRRLIRPEEGMALAYLDYSQQEFGIAAALSKDSIMMEAYASGDPYLAFAIQAGGVPANATKNSHKVEREMFKAAVLAVQYGMGEESLAHRIGQPVSRARHLLALHRKTYPTYWRWSDGVENHALLLNELHTVWGWTVRPGTTPNARSLRNFPMQANGAEMLRLACCMAVENGVAVCAPVHDAVLIEAKVGDIDDAVERMTTIMREASEVVLDGFSLRSDAKIIRFPDRFAPDRGGELWSLVWELLGVSPAP